MPTITVTSLANSGAGTFRQAIISAAANDTINFSVTGEIVLTSGQLTIGKNLTITAPGIDQLIVSSNGTGRVMEITTGVVHMTGLYMRHGLAATGGGLVNSGTTTMTDCKVSNNTATGKGGGIWNEGTLTLNNVLVQANESSDHGGGIYNSGTLTLGSLTDLASNVVHGANHDGGGIYNDSGTVTLTEATLDSNTATRHGGAFYNSGTVYLIRSTASVNQSASGAIYNYLGTVYNRNSTISDNIGGIGANIFGSVYFVQCTVISNGDGWNNGLGSMEVGNSIFVDNGTDIYGSGGAITSNGHNIIGTFNDDFTPDGSDITGTLLAELKLGDLDDNGGPTLTRKLLTHSPAIDAGDNALPPYVTDQRGTGFARILNGTVDIGAYESAVVLPVPIINPGEVCVAEGTFREILYDPTPKQIAAVQAALNAKATAYVQGLAFTLCPSPVNQPCIPNIADLPTFKIGTLKTFQFQGPNPNGGPYTFTTASPLPDSATLSASGLLTYVGGYSEQRDFPLTITVSDGSATCSVNATLHLQCSPTCAEAGAKTDPSQLHWSELYGGPSLLTPVSEWDTGSNGGMAQAEGQNGQWYPDVLHPDYPGATFVSDFLCVDTTRTLRVTVTIPDAGGIDIWYAGVEKTAGPAPGTYVLDFPTQGCNNDQISMIMSSLHGTFHVEWI